VGQFPRAPIVAKLPLDVLHVNNLRGASVALQTSVSAARAVELYPTQNIAPISRIE